MKLKLQPDYKCYEGDRTSGMQILGKFSNLVGGGNLDARALSAALVAMVTGKRGLGGGAGS